MPSIMNGSGDADERNMDDLLGQQLDEDEKTLHRPIEIEEDVRSTEQKQRVKSALNSQSYRKELESIIADRLGQASIHDNLNECVIQSPSLFTICSSSAKIPINDIRGADHPSYTKEERLLRCKLASLFRLVHMFGWSNGVHNQITLRINQENEHFLVNPYGLLYHEITASNLLKVDSNGEVIGEENCSLSPNSAGFNLHCSIHRARPDIKCIIHMHSAAASAVSVLKCGLLPICQEALLLGGISYHDYHGIISESEIKHLLSNDLGPFNKVMILRNHGLMACGETIEEAWHIASNAMKACEIQCKALPFGLNNIIIPSETIQENMIEAARRAALTHHHGDNSCTTGEVEFEALMRVLDNAGLRTGYVYKQPTVKAFHKPSFDVTLPAHVSSLNFIHEQMKESLLKYREYGENRSEWLITPNAYVKKQVFSRDPSLTLTQWTPDVIHRSSTPIKIESKHQFAPSGIDPNELKRQQKQIKRNQLEEKVSPGYLSKILDRVNTMDETDSSNLSDRTIIIGAASRGVVKREEQVNPSVYHSVYSQNPFAHVDSAEVLNYTSEIESKQIKNQEYQKSLSDAAQPALKKSDTMSSTSSQGHTSPDRKEKKKSNFRTPSFLKRKKRDNHSQEKQSS